MERYEIVVDDEGNYCGLIPSENGSVVKYADAQATVGALQANRCETCGAKVKDYVGGCPGCSAPQCCPMCCRVEELQRKKDEAITTHRNIVKQFDELTCFIGCDYDPETETWVSGKPPYLSAGTNEVEACKAAVDALRSVAIVLQAALDAERESSKRQAERWTRSKPLQAGWYWYRDLTQQPEVLQVWNREGVLWVDYYGMSLDSFSNGEWQGPLTPNEATA